jgi:hypothetical protein
MKKKLNEAEYNLSITGLNTTDGDTLSQIVAMANQADNGGMGEVAPEAAPIDPYEDGMVDDTAIDTPFDTMEDDPTTDEMGYGVPVDEPEMNAYANPEMDTAVVPVDDMMDDDNDIMPDDFVNGEDEMEENNFNEEEPYTHPCAHEDSGNILTEDEGKSGYSVMVKDKEYARIDTDKEYSDDEIINQFLKQYMAKTGKEFPYIDQIVVQRNGGDVEEDVLLPKDDDNEFIPEEEDFMVEDDDFDMSDEQINEEIDNILWSAGMKGCSKKEEKGVNTKSLMEDDSSNTFQNLSDEKVQELYKKYKEQGLSDDEIFDKIYSEDCNLDNVDEAKAVWKPADEDPNIDSMAYLDDDAKQVYDLYLTGDYSNKEIIDMLRDAGFDYQGARQLLQDWIALNESENPEMNMEDCDAPNPAEMNLDDKEQVDEADGKKYFYGIKPIQYIYHGDWSDPELRYKGHSINYWDFENALYEIFKEEGGQPDNDKAFGEWVQNNKDLVKSEIEDWISLGESAYSPKLKDPNRKTPTRANYVDVNVNADAKSGTLGFEYPAPTNGKVSLSSKAGKIMETAKHLMSKAEGEKKDKLLSRYTFKLMNEGVSFSDAKRILSKF